MGMQVSFVVRVKVRVCVEVEQGQEFAFHVRCNIEGWVRDIVVSAQKESLLVLMVVELCGCFYATSQRPYRFHFPNVSMVADSPQLGEIDASRRRTRRGAAVPGPRREAPAMRL